MNHRRKLEELTKAAKRAVEFAPKSAIEDSSVQQYACCGEVELHHHAQDCWWQQLKDAVDALES